MSGEETSTPAPIPTSSNSDLSQVQYDYNNMTSTSSASNHDSSNKKVPIFSGDALRFEWWKDSIYHYVNGIDDELCDLIEEGVPIDGIGSDSKITIAQKRALSAENKKIFSKYNKVKQIMMSAISRDEYTKIMDRSTAKAMYDSLCSNYDGNRQVQNAKVRLLVQQYELFTMKPNEDIETMFSIFQTLVSNLRILNKSYTTSDHVWKILNSLTDKWRPKVTTIEEAKDLEKISLESLISNLKSHEMVLNADAVKKKERSVALTSTRKSLKTVKAKTLVVEEDSSSDDQEEEEEDEELAMFTRNFQKWARMSKSRTGNSSRSTPTREEKNCFKCNKPGHFIA